ncbi:cadherin-16 [Pelodytes ibericus]
MRNDGSYVLEAYVKSLWSLSATRRKLAGLFLNIQRCKQKSVFAYLVYVQKEYALPPPLVLNILRVCSMFSMKSIYLLAFLSASSQATSAAILREETFEFPENYVSSGVWYLTKIKLEADGPYDTELAGDEEGIFEFDPQSGLLWTGQSFDREKKESYTLQIIRRDKDQKLIEMVTVTIKIKDLNDNKPRMTQDTFYGRISKGSRPGVAFTHVHASDADDPLTANADLRYTILSHHSDLSKDMFQVDSRTGAVSLTEQGASLLPELQVDKFRVTVQVNDMGDMSDEVIRFTDTAVLHVDIAENTWVTPSPLTLLENLSEDYPVIISTVTWNSTEVQYSLSGNFQGDLFTVDDMGNIYISGPLDREAQSEFQIVVSAVNTYSVPYTDPLEVTITALDVNDNSPTFSKETYHLEITEKVTKGTVLLTLTAEDADDKDTANAEIRYRIVSQEPGNAEDLLFHIDEQTGTLTLQERFGQAVNAKAYKLLVSATDLAGAQGGKSSTCVVTIDMKDLNDNPPVFLESQSAPFVIPEDATPGLLIATLTATDEDDLADNKLIDLYVQSGNEDTTFRISTDGQTNTLAIYLEKDLDYESHQKYDLTVLARNRAPLVGTEYGPSSTATVRIAVQDVNEAPVFTQQEYEVRVPENAQTGSVILTVEANDPDIYNKAKLHYSIRNDSRKWLSIQEHSGKIQLLHALDREVSEETYSVQVIATEQGEDGLSATADVMIHILDVNDNVPFLIGDNSKAFFCSRKVDTQRMVLQASDLDTGDNSSPFTFKLTNDPTVQARWKITALNGTHACLAMLISYLEPKVHYVPIIITDSGTPPQSQHVHLPVSVCQCGSQEHCITEVNRMENMPTLSQALSTLLGTLGAIGFFLIVLFAHMALSAPKKNSETPDSIPLKGTKCNV